MDVNRVKELVNEALAGLAKVFPSAYFYLKGKTIVFDLETTNAHAWTNGRIVAVTPEFTKLPVRERAAVLAHEALHDFMMHGDRLGRYMVNKHVALIVNLVADAKVNVMLMDVFSGLRILRNALDFVHTKFNIDYYEIKEKSSEELVEKVLAQLPKAGGQGQSDNDGSEEQGEEQGGSGDEEGDNEEQGSRSTSQKGRGKGKRGKGDEGDESGDSDGSEEMERQLVAGRDLVEGRNRDVSELQEIQKGKGRGKDSDAEDLKRAIQEALLMGAGVGDPVAQQLIKQFFEPQVDWQRLLKAEVSSWLRKNVLVDYSKESRRHSELYGVRNMGSPRLWVFVDVSGSVWDQVKQFLSEVAGMVSATAEMMLVLWDTDVRAEKRIRSKGDLLGIEVVGGGGTKFAPVLRKYMNKVKSEDMVIVMTDEDWWDRGEAERLLRLVRAPVFVYNQGKARRWRK